MGNWVIICHGGPDFDAGQVEVPHGTELQFWVNEGQPAKVGAAVAILEELQRNPVDIGSLQRLIDHTEWGSGVRWQATHGVAGRWVTALVLHGDRDIECVGAHNLTTGQFQRWPDAQSRITLKQLLQVYTGNVNLICCR